jgi:5-methylcytosine-specific restriction protein B
MRNYFIFPIDSFVKTFSRIESGTVFEFTISTENAVLNEQVINVGDVVLATLNNKVYYNLIVSSISSDYIVFKKSFEIEKEIEINLGNLGELEIVSQENYEKICSELFMDYQKTREIDNKENLEEFQVIKDKVIGQFVFKVLDFLYKKDDLAKINHLITKNADPKYSSIKYEDLSLTSIFKTSETELNSEDLKFKDEKPRFFEKVLFSRAGEYYYLSTEWTAGKDSRLDLLTFKKVIEINYPEFSISEESNEYIFSLSSIRNLGLNQKPFDLKSFQDFCEKSGLIFDQQLVRRFAASLCTKPFVICSGLSGSGKTKLAQAFAKWISADKSQYKIVPVGSDWTNREPLLGYPNALDNLEYVVPENGVLELMIRAKLNYENSSEPTKPYFLILDEMNLSHVERYFADFLSTMESGDEIPLHTIDKERNDIPQTIKLPKNLFIIGTVNIDETTYMFSPKVLDRANTIEFRLTESDLIKFISSERKMNLDVLSSQGSNMSNGFIKLAVSETDKKLLSKSNDLVLFFTELKKSGAEFGYRTASEIGRLMKILEILGEKDDSLLDIAIMQKLLPKLHGSRSKLTNTLTTLAKFCVDGALKSFDGKDDEFRKQYFIPLENLTSDKAGNIKYKISFEKITRMHKNAVENGFTSYAEA